MKAIEIKLKRELIWLKRIVNEKRNKLKDVPNGHLRISKKHDCVEYYYSDAATGRNGRYMKRSEIGLAKDIAQRDYDRCILKNAEERMQAIAAFLEKYESTCLEEIYDKMNPCRRELIHTDVISDDEYVKRWLSVEYEGKAFSEEVLEIFTEKGERVRSKSEKIIADKLYALGIPYRYEYPLLLEGSIRIYPDFTILKMPERQEVYLEHFGRMDDSSYVDNVMYKLNTYEKNGIFLGVNLFVTYETGRMPLNTRALDGLLRKLFCME